MNKIEQLLKDLLSALQAAKIYTTDHPLFMEALDKFYEELKGILMQRDELVIGIVGDEIASGKEIFFDLSKKLKSIIGFFKKIGVERIVFSQGLHKEEIIKFINCLSNPPENASKDLKNYFNAIGIRNISVGKVRGAVSGIEDKEVQEAIKELSHYEESLDKVSDSVDAVLNGESIQYVDFRYTISNVMDNLMGKHQEFLKLTDVRRHDASTFVHLLNVSILSMYFSFKLGFAKDDVLDIGTAAIFHDIGKIYISKKIIQKPDRLTDKEFTAIKSHTILGVEILLKYRDVLGMLPPVVAFEHHLRFDGSGYPKPFFYQIPHRASLIICLCDVYDALIQRRSYKRDYPPDMVYRLMVKERGKMFDPGLFDDFFKIVGVWPTGTIVSLSDGRVAIVREQSQKDIFSPKIEVIEGNQKGESIDLEAEKEKIKIENTINPLGEGRKYLSLI